VSIRLRRLPFPILVFQIAYRLGEGLRRTSRSGPRGRHAVLDRRDTTFPTLNIWSGTEPSSRICFFLMRWKASLFSVTLSETPRAGWIDQHLEDGVGCAVDGGEVAVIWNRRKVLPDSRRAWRTLRLHARSSSVSCWKIPATANGVPVPC